LCSMSMASDWGGHSGSRLGLDIGGTLAKLVFFESEIQPSWCNGRIAEVIKSLGGCQPKVGTWTQSTQTLQSQRSTGFKRQNSFWGEHDMELAFYDAELKGTFHFLCFQSDQMERFVSLLLDQQLDRDIDEIFTTGGGAYKYRELFQERLCVKLLPVDELSVVIKGISWLVKRPIPEKVCLLVEEDKGPEEEIDFLETSAQDLFPFILVNIGSGVSIVKVDSIDKIERISGSAMGGGTFWGLCKLLCPSCVDFAEASAIAAEGDSANVNLLVEDIYGGDYELPNGAKLPGNLVASFFAKARGAGRGSEADIMHALNTMVSQNICQIAYLNARLHSVSRILFTGNFLRQNTVARKVIASNMRRVSTALPGRQQLQALFLKHEGYFGALGSFLHNVEEASLDVPVPMSKRWSDSSEEDVPRTESWSRQVCESFQRSMASSLKKLGPRRSQACCQSSSDAKGKLDSIQPPPQELDRA